MREIFQPELSVRDLAVELILQIDIGRLPRKILVGAVAERDRSPRQDIVDSRLETGVLGFCGFQRLLDRVRDRLQGAIDPSPYRAWRNGPQTGCWPSFAE